MKPAIKIGDRVVYTKSFLRNIGATNMDPMWHKVGPVVGLGSTATTWHCTKCNAELGYIAPSKGRDMFWSGKVVKFTPNAAPKVSPCCNAEVTTKEHACGAYSMSNMVRVVFDGETFETTINVANVARKGSFHANEETRI